MGSRMKNFNLVAHWKIRFLGSEGVGKFMKKNIYRGKLPKKGGMDSLHI